MIRTRRWNDPGEKGDGTRVLICRYRPRGVKKSDETWDEWVPDLGPSRELHAEVYSDHGLPWSDYRRRYLQEMQHPRAAPARIVGRAHHAALLVGLHRREPLPPFAAQGADRN